MLPSDMKQARAQRRKMKVKPERHNTRRKRRKAQHTKVRAERRLRVNERLLQLQQLLFLCIYTSNKCIVARGKNEKFIIRLTLMQSRATDLGFQFLSSIVRFDDLEGVIEHRLDLNA